MDPESQQAWEELGRRGGSVVCPICGHGEERAFGGDADLHIVLHAVRSHADLVATRATEAGLATWAFVCSNCGFVRLHAKETLSKPQDH
jgi:hypothetical protein